MQHDPDDDFDDDLLDRLFFWLFWLTIATAICVPFGLLYLVLA